HRKRGHHPRHRYHSLRRPPRQRPSPTHQGSGSRRLRLHPDGRHLRDPQRRHRPLCPPHLRRPLHSQRRPGFLRRPHRRHHPQHRHAIHHRQPATSHHRKR